MPERYAVVSCHVERLLDDDAWAAFRSFQARRPGGFRIAPLVRPPDPESGECGPDADAHEAAAERWAERARALAAEGPLGLHTHYGGRSHGRARPGDPPPHERVRAELATFAAHGLAPRFFCGGNWYIDADVAVVLAAEGLADCTATAFRPGHLPEGAARLALAAPARLRLDPGHTTGGAPAADSPLFLQELPTTHSLGMTARAAASPSAPAALHCYFHDYDLLVPARARALAAALAVLGRRRPRLDLDGLRAAAFGERAGPGAGSAGESLQGREIAFAEAAAPGR